MPESENLELLIFRLYPADIHNFLGVFMRKNTKITLAFIGSAFLLLAGFASCKADDEDDEKEAEIESVSISAGASTISATGSTTLTATPGFSSTVDSPEVTYSWSVSENTGGGYFIGLNI